MTSLESCREPAVTSWCKLKILDESQMLTPTTGVYTKRTVFIVTAWLSQQHVQQSQETCFQAIYGGGEGLNLCLEGALTGG